MNALLNYTIATVVSLGIFYSAYAVFLRGEPMFRFNRIYLLLSLLLSFLIPLLIFIPDMNLHLGSANPGKGIMNIITLAPVEISAETGRSITIFNVLGFIYYIGLAFFAGRLLIRLISIIKIVRSGSRSIENETAVTWIASGNPPFSFIRTIYLPVNLQGKTQLDKIIRHEQIHIQEHHSMDILFIQIMQIVSWFNPFIPLIEKSLREIHEFEADKAVIFAGTDPVIYTRLLFENDKTALAVVLGNNFNYSLIKRRLSMFYKKSTRFARLKAVLVLPLAICSVMFYAVSCNQSELDVKKNISSADTSENYIADPSTGEVEYSTTPAVVDEKVIKTGEGVPPPPPPPPPPTSKNTGPNEVFTVVETMPQFPGGDEARMTYLMNTIQYPEAAKKEGQQGTVFVSFIIEKDGSIKDAKVLRGIGKECDQEALRVIKGMPKWVPGKQRGEEVRVQFNMPIKFKLDN